MGTRIFPNDDLHRSVLRLPFFIVAAIAIAACHPGNEQAKQLRQSCEAGEAKACNQLAVRLQKGEYVLRDDREASEMFDKACDKRLAKDARTSDSPISVGKASSAIPFAL
jgi:hypothetical protein